MPHFLAQILNSSPLGRECLWVGALGRAEQNTVRAQSGSVCLRPDRVEFGAAACAQCFVRGVGKAHPSSGPYPQALPPKQLQLNKNDPELARVLL
ncbi:hypothetical protein [Zwartia vadi]|uniref:hypothetical protein n=1 Tax=Zwartia vadi TaxID=3058168 RepID=UPI0025B42964|nr:hypothetical protein [Zwartia vadi]MDN3987357.1 hypothetical protein [Zwartia vadi]